jgi:uncharacterized protein YecE (DUF72 family)
MRLRVGCCGFAASHSKYHSAFPVVEIQQTFYQPPQLNTAEKWRKGAPPNFEYTMKAWQLITHESSSPTYRRLKEPIGRWATERYGAFRNTPEVREAWRRTREFAGALGAKIIVFQCPATYRPTEANVANLRRFFENIGRDPFLFAWEPRGAWPDPLVGKLCEDLELVHCVDPLKNRALHGKVVYYRLHGRTGYRYTHTEEDFAEISAGLRPDVPNYVLFNNMEMFSDARRFSEYMRQASESGGNPQGR